MANQHPEQKARDKIDKRLRDAGWVVIDDADLEWHGGIGVAVREYSTKVGPVDYALFLNREPVGVIEAKRDEEGHRITIVEEQAANYANSKLKDIDNAPLVFRYIATGVLTYFIDTRDPSYRSREVFNFHRPENLLRIFNDENSLRKKLKELPPLDSKGLRKCQITAVTNLEESFKLAKPKALIQMATGAGKTFTAITSIYRLLKHANANRILFMVDTKNLGEQAEQEFMAFTPNDDNHKFTELYNVTRLRSRHVPTDSQVYISTVQRLYSILKGEDLEETAEDTNPREASEGDGPPVNVVYNDRLPMEFFDFIVIDECHRSIYNRWKQVLDYFDAFQIGLTATPDKRTFGFFNQNVVSEYAHPDAVVDGVNVGPEVFVIETKITKNGAVLEANEYVDKRERLTRKTRWEQLDEEVAYAANKLDKDVVNVDQIRTIVQTVRDKLPSIFPGRTEVPKTLFFAKTDSHADDIIQMIREEFGEGNEFCKKITYKAKEDPKSVLASFRNSYNPRIAVTVDQIATGTDVKPLECLVFMRDVRSKNYYEQMLGRGTRTFSKGDLQKVTPSAKTDKTHFVVIDAVGVSKSIKTDVRPLEQQKSVPLATLLKKVLMGNQSEETYSSLASRLIKLDKILTEPQKKEAQRLANGHTLSEIAQNLLDAHNPDYAEDQARKEFDVPKGEEPTIEQLEKVRKKQLKKCQGMLNGKLNKFIEKARTTAEQIIDNLNQDEVQVADWSKSQQERNRSLVQDFEQLLEEHKDEITALQILYNEPHRRREITYKMISELFEKLKLSRPNIAPVRIYRAYADLYDVKPKPSDPKTELTAIVALVRRVTGVDKKISQFSKVVDHNFQKWVFDRHAGDSRKFSEEQMEWLRMIKEHVSTSFHLKKEDFELAPFVSRGGIGKMYELFRADMDSLIEELNEVLVA